MNSNYENYFSNRRITSKTYESHTLPNYILDLIGDNSEISILDFGCGFGQNLKALNNIGFNNTIGYDIEPAAINYCIKNGVNIIDGIKFSLSDVNQKYDLILATHVLEHISKDSIIKTVKELKTLLNDNGLLFISVPNAQSNTGCYWHYEDFTHTTLFTSGSLFYVLREAGFIEISLCDKDCLSGLNVYKKILRSFFLKIYRINNYFWNKITSSSYHKPSPVVNSYEIKMVAKNVKSKEDYKYHSDLLDGYNIKNSS